MIFKDNNSGVALKQITMKSEFTDHVPTVIPNTMMDWGTAKMMYPDAQVFIYPFDRLIDDLAIMAFEDPLKKQFNPEEGFIFPTLNLTDDRMNHKVMVYGYDNGIFFGIWSHWFAHTEVLQ